MLDKLVGSGTVVLAVDGLRLDVLLRCSLVVHLLGRQLKILGLLEHVVALVGPSALGCDVVDGLGEGVVERRVHLRVATEGRLLAAVGDGLWWLDDGLPVRWRAYLIFGVLRV